MVAFMQERGLEDEMIFRASDGEILSQLGAIPGGKPYLRMILNGETDLQTAIWWMLLEQRREQRKEQRGELPTAKEPSKKLYFYLAGRFNEPPCEVEI